MDNFKENTDIEEIISNLMDTKFKSILHDIDYRIQVFYDALERVTKPSAESRVGSRDLNLAHHVLDGFAFSNNSPANGSVSWTGCHIVYKGVSYAITDGNTALKYIWWKFSASPNTVFQTSATKPTLTADDVLIGINNGGIFQPTITPGKLLPGGAIADGTIGTNELGDKAITTAKIANAAITSGLLANGAVTSNAIAAGAVTAPAIGAGAVASENLDLATHMLY